MSLMYHSQLQPQYFFQTSNNHWELLQAKHLLGVYLVLDIILCVLGALTHFIFITTLWGLYAYYLPFKGEETLTQKGQSHIAGEWQ